MVRSRPWSGLTLALTCLESLDLPLGLSRKLGLAEVPKMVRVLKVSRRLRVPQSVRLRSLGRHPQVDRQFVVRLELRESDNKWRSQK
ncbi:uncharacterized protein FPRO_05197 [Fusarium proliferatum ET1]|uniref:Uncharacterized protein n=1 Tax=Fusarium proliferatum (strain ET1) TaxID=1227346 RepID=A0A1L7VIA1_FUSPR|nr:uncharacterized protein FPRO_05197 [Fusarium proliferatum ET1]CZR40297.1 uncharacterized protein FPRO_05197 [Fusarium proliferatum ET1]